MNNGMDSEAATIDGFAPGDNGTVVAGVARMDNTHRAQRLVNATCPLDEPPYDNDDLTSPGTRPAA